MFRSAAWSCAALLAILSLLPAEKMVRTSLGGHIEHATAYAVTAFLSRLGYSGWGWKLPTVALMIYAGVLELLQTLSPGRHSAVEDWLASSAGVLLGISVVHVVASAWKTGDTERPPA
jgi:VanZ family protein